MVRPRTGYHVDLAGVATALVESLLMNHPSVGGNKRVAFNHLLPWLRKHLDDRG